MSRFARLLESLDDPEDATSLVETALLLAGGEYPQLDIDSYLHRFDTLAERLMPRLTGAEGISADNDAWIRDRVIEVRRIGPRVT